MSNSLLLNSSLSPLFDSSLLAPVGGRGEGSETRGKEPHPAKIPLSDSEVLHQWTRGVRYAPPRPFILSQKRNGPNFPSFGRPSSFRDYVICGECYGGGDTPSLTPKLSF